MPQDVQQSKQEILARAGLVLSSFMFALGAVVAFSSGASAMVVGALSTCAGVLLWVAIFANQKVALILGRFFPLG